MGIKLKTYFQKLKQSHVKVCKSISYVSVKQQNQIDCLGFMMNVASYKLN